MRDINIDIGNSQTETLKIQIFNVSISKVTLGIVYPLIRYKDTEKRQFYTFGINFYNITTGKAIDKMYIPKNQLPTECIRRI